MFKKYYCSANCMCLINVIAVPNAMCLINAIAVLNAVVYVIL